MNILEGAAQLLPSRPTCLSYETLRVVARRDTVFVGDTVREMESAADWVALSDEELLERRISKLGLELETTPLEPLIQQLYAELSAKGLRSEERRVGKECR